MDAPDTVLIERAQGKRVDPKTGDIYHTTFDLPSNPEIQSRLEEVPGYKEDEMVKKLIEYHRHIDGVLDCYKTTIKTINADQPKADVFSQGNVEVMYKLSIDLLCKINRFVVGVVKPL